VAGQLTPGWNTVFWMAWAGVVAGLAGVWYSARVTGFSTWWLGPEAEPRSIAVSLVPFVAPIAVALAGLRAARRLPLWGCLAAVATAAVGAADLPRVSGYGAAELVLAAAGLLVSTACFAGVLRR
jgi:hypothetical protein